MLYWRREPPRRSRVRSGGPGGGPRQTLRTDMWVQRPNMWVSSGIYPFASWFLVWLIFQVEIDRRNAVQLDGMFMGVDSHQGMCQPKCFRSSDLHFIFFFECCRLFNEYITLPRVSWHDLWRESTSLLACYVTHLQSCLYSQATSSGRPSASGQHMRVRFMLPSTSVVKRIDARRYR